MNAMSKVVLLTATILSMGALTACQTTSSTQDAKGAEKADRPHHDRKMSPEKREQFKQHQAERKAFSEQLKKACEGKNVGQTAQVQAGDKTIDGTCVSHFKIDRKDMKEMHKAHHPKQEKAYPRGPAPQLKGEPLTDAKRAELTKQFDQRLAERQAREQAIAKACKGQKDGKTVQFKVGEQTINGQCQVRFQPNAPVAPTPVKAS